MMNKNFIIKSGLVIILFGIAIYEDNRVISFIFFTLPWFIILYPFFFKKQIRTKNYFQKKIKKINLLLEIYFLNLIKMLLNILKNILLITNLKQRVFITEFVSHLILSKYTVLIITIIIFLHL